MKQKLFVILVLGFLIALLAVLNAATYVQKEKVPDTEFAPNRSTYNPGSTGTQAFYTLLSETGHAAGAVVVEHATGARERITPLDRFRSDERPYFSTILCYRGEEAWASGGWGA